MQRCRAPPTCESSRSKKFSSSPCGRAAIVAPSRAPHGRIVSDKSTDAHPDRLNGRPRSRSRHSELQSTIVVQQHSRNSRAEAAPDCQLIPAAMLLPRPFFTCSTHAAIPASLTDGDRSNGTGMHDFHNVPYRLPAYLHSSLAAALYGAPDFTHYPLGHGTRPVHRDTATQAFWRFGSPDSGIALFS